METITFKPSQKKIIEILDSNSLKIENNTLNEQNLVFNIKNLVPITYYLQIQNNKSLTLNFNCYSKKSINLIIILQKSTQEKENNNININYIFNYYESQNVNLYYLNIEDISIKEKFDFNLSFIYSEINFYLASLVGKKTKKELFINANHFAKKTKSKLKTYSIIKNSATQVVKCTSNIVKKMVDSEAHQEIRLLVFDKQGTAISDPILLIDENNVIASHANAVGMLNPNDIFYLQSRGLTLNEAKKIIIMGYFKPVIAAIVDKKLQAKVLAMINFEIEEV